MSDVWSTVMFRATFAGQPLDVLTTRDSFGRALTRNGYPGRDGARVNDLGATAREVDLLVVFFDPRRADPDDAPIWATLDHVARSKAFIETCQAGEARELVHPLFGSFPAMAETQDVSAGGENRDQISVSARFVEQGLDPAPLQSSVARPIMGGTAAVAAEAGAAVAAAAIVLPAAGAATVATVAGDAAAEADRWDADPDIDARSITVGLQKASENISDTIRTLEIASQPRMYPLYRALSRLHAQMRMAATIARRDAPALVTITTASAAPLRVILGDVYGARDADVYMPEAIRLNGVTDPALVDAGTVLTLPTPAQVGAQRTRRQGPAYGR